MTAVVESTRIARRVISSTFPIGVATTYKQPVVRFCCTITLFFYFILLFTISGCQNTTTETIPDGGYDEQDRNNGYDRTESGSPYSLEEEFVRRLDLAYRSNIGVRDQSIQSQFEAWPPKQSRSTDVDRWNYVQTLTEFVLEGLHDPARTQVKLNNLRTQDEQQYRAKVILISYLYLWVEDCESAIDALSTHEPKTAHASALWVTRMWSVLASPCAYRSLFINGSGNLSVQGWWDLAKIMITSNSQQERVVKYRSWKFKYSQHLAAQYPPAVFQKQYEVPRKIALLLPQSGPLSSAATAIKNGFLSAHLQTVPPESVSIDVHDTSTTEITTLIEQVVDEGVDVIVGPLDKDNVRRVLDRNSTNVPIVTLNRPSLGIQFSPQRNLVQLAQVVEDDAVAVAKQLHRQDLQRVLLVLGDRHWCVRAALSFRDTIDDSVIIAAETVLSDLSESTQNVADLLRVTQSATRQSDIAHATRRTIEFTARRRHDIDAIVAFVDQDEFTALSAALHYHFAGNIPMFLIEPTFRDLTRAGSYADGTTFTTTPAHLYPFSLTTQIQKSFADASVLYPLYVFGIDAYRTTMQVEGVLSGEAIFGYTGYLQRNDSGALVREPLWGIVQGRTFTPRKHIISRNGINRYLF